MISKKGQEEIVGFVMIVVVVAVLGLIFLVISLRNGEEIERESRDVRLFLESAGELTLECSGNGGENTRKMLIECYNKEQCESGKKACEVLKRSLEESIEAGFQYGHENAVKGYEFNASYSRNSSKSGEEVLFISKGNCSSGIKSGAEEFISASLGVISYSLELCY